MLPLEEMIRPFAAADRGISFVDGATRLDLSYQDLAGRTASAAARLRRAGVRPGALVATTISNDLPSVLAVLATWASGATLVSLPPATRGARDWYARQFGPALTAMGCTVLIADEDPDAGVAAGAALRHVPKAALAEPGRELGALPETPVPATALIQFTSGSVGAPKGVAISSRALAGHVAAVIAAGQFDGDSDRIVSWLPLYHDMGLIVMFLMGLATRMDQVLAPPSSFATRPASWLTTLARERATVTAAPNFAYRLAAAVPYDDGLDLSRMRVAISGGERLDWQTLLDFHATAGPMGFDWGALMPCYGLAEGTVAVSYSPVGRGPLEGPGGYVSAGRPLPGVELQVTAGSSPEPVKLRGDWLFSGYHTNEGFDAVTPGEWFDTGDAGFVHDGELYVRGRRDEVLAMAGRNVFAEDIESVAHQAGGELIRCCAAFRNPAVTDRFALMVEVNPRRVKGLDAARDLARSIQASVTETLGTRLRPVLIVRLGAIPRTTSGKVRRAQCRSIYHARQVGQRLITELA